MTINDKIIKALKKEENFVQIIITRYRYNSSKHVVKAEVNGVNGVFELSARGVNLLDFNAFYELGMHKDKETISPDGRTKISTYSNKKNK